MAGTSLESHTARAAAVSGVPGVELLGPLTEDASRVLTAPALAFVARLARAFEERRRELLAARAARQRRILDGERPDFLPETRDICPGGAGRRGSGAGGAGSGASGRRG